MNRNEKKENKISRDLKKMSQRGWGINREYICITAKKNNRLVYGWTKQRDEHVYCPFHNEMYDESEGHFENIEKNCKAA